MGQRLNIEIMSGEKVLANAYYHWSAYTASAAELTKIILGDRTPRLAGHSSAGSHRRRRSWI